MRTVRLLWHVGLLQKITASLVSGPAFAVIIIRLSDISILIPGLAHHDAFAAGLCEACP